MSTEDIRNAEANTPPDEDAVLARTRRISVAEGILAQIHFSVAAPGSVFLTKFAVLLGATPFQFGLLAAFGQLSLVFQPLGSLLTRRSRSRRGVTVGMALFSRALVFFFGALPFLVSENRAITLFLVLFLLSASAQAVSANAWVAWISDMIPRELRGRFFARRSQYLLAAGAITGYALGGLIDWFPSSRSLPLVGRPDWVRAGNLPQLFLGIFVFAALVGVLGQLVLWRQPERPKRPERDSARALLVRPFRDPNFRRMVVFACWWMLAVGVGAPFWQPFMIQKLQMPLLEIQLYATISTVCGFAALGLWGRFIDRFGNKSAMALAIVMGGINPLPWLFVGPAGYGILFIEAAFSGAMWAGSGLVGMNFILAVAPERRRQIYSGLYGACSGLAMMLTMLLSGAFLPPALHVGERLLEPEQVLFGATAVLRWTALIPLFWIHEPEVPSTAETLLTLRQFAKVRIAYLAERVIRRR